MSKRSLLFIAGALLVFLAGVGVGTRIGDDNEARATSDDEAAETDDARRSARRSSPRGPSFDQWIGGAGSGPADTDRRPEIAAPEPSRELDGGMPDLPAHARTPSIPGGGHVTLNEAPSDPGALQEAETTIAAALARGTLTAEDREQLGNLLADISSTDRDRLAQRIIGALSEGRLRLDANL